LANKYAIEIPYQTAKKCYEVMQLAEILIEKGNPSSLTDAGVASEVAFAGLRGGCMNVLINLPELIDKPYINQKQKEVDNLLKKGERLNRKLFKKTISSLEMTG
jgi:formiminotetrahydrofolate cyclodeaminase